MIFLLFLAWVLFLRMFFGTVPESSKMNDFDRKTIPLPGKDVFASKSAILGPFLASVVDENL